MDSREAQDREQLATIVANFMSRGEYDELIAVMTTVLAGVILTSIAADKELLYTPANEQWLNEQSAVVRSGLYAVIRDYLSKQGYDQTAEIKIGHHRSPGVKRPPQQGP